MLLFCSFLDPQDPTQCLGLCPRQSLCAGMNDARQFHPVWLSQDCPRITTLLHTGAPPRGLTALLPDPRPSKGYI